MYLYDKVNDKINIYETKIDNDLLRKFKEKHLKEILTAKVITNDAYREKLLYGVSVLFSALDYKKNKKYSYFQVTNNDDTLEEYLSGELDEVIPTYIGGSASCGRLSSYTKDINGKKYNLENNDYVYLFTGGHYNGKEFVSDDDILLSGELGNLQPVLCGDLERMNYLTEYNYNEEFFKTFNYKKIYTLSYRDLDIAHLHDLAYKDINLEEKLEKSNLILSMIKKAHK